MWLYGFFILLDKKASFDWSFNSKDLEVFSHLNFLCKDSKVLNVFTLGFLPRSNNEGKILYFVGGDITLGEMFLSLENNLLLVESSNVTLREESLWEGLLTEITFREKRIL